MKEHPILFKGEMVRAILSDQKTQTRRTNLKTKYAVGDRLWVRETWRPDDHDFGQPWPTQWHLEMQADKAIHRTNPPESELESWASRFGTAHTTGGCNPKWRPSLFMPRWASRITLEVTAVREERLQDITSADAIAEGCPPHANSSTIDCATEDPRDDYRRLWESINGPGSWDENPVVRVISFKVVK